MKDASKAMVVDDSKAMRMILRRSLGELGFSVSEAANGQDALVVLRNEEKLPSLILVDWNMPIMSGLELVKALRSDQRYAGVTLIMVTTETEIQQMSLALEAGANEYVMKPFTKETIAEKLQMMSLGH
jgi:two-component system, chemotaxis family, chemotaxis protein CheY